MRHTHVIHMQPVHMHYMCIALYMIHMVFLCNTCIALHMCITYVPYMNSTCGTFASVHQVGVLTHGPSSSSMVQTVCTINHYSGKGH